MRPTIATQQHYATPPIAPQPFVLLTVSFVAGIVADHFWDLSATISTAAMILATFGWLLFRAVSPKNVVASSTMIFVLLSATGSLWHHANWNWFSDNDIGVFASEQPQAAAVRGRLTTEPVLVAAPPWHQSLDTMKPGQRYRFRMKPDSIRVSDQWVKTSGETGVHVFLPEEDSATSNLETDWRCGERIEVIGFLRGSRPTSNPGQFDFATHFRSRRQLASLLVDSPTSIKKLTAGESGLSILAQLRTHIDQLFHRHLPPENAAFASAVMLGNRDQMEAETRELFLKTGTSHLLAISGLHVGILAGGIWLLMKTGVLSRRRCLILAIVFVFAYAWLVELRPTVLRASILISVMCGARLLGRTALSWSSLAVALFAVLIFNPTDLFSLGTQLSFLAISSIIIGRDWIYKPPHPDPVRRLIARTRSLPVRSFHSAMRHIRAAFCVSLLIWLLALPLVAFHFHSIALISPVLNPLLLWPITIALFSGIVTVCLGSISATFAAIPAAVCSMNLGLIQSMIGSAASVPGSHFWSSGPPAISVAVFYAGLFAFAVLPKAKLSGSKYALLLLFWFTFGWVLPERISDWFRVRQQQLEVILIDVDHGSSALIKLPDGRNLLCDGGSLSGSSKAAMSISSVLWHQKIERLDAVIVSHADVDHFNALPELAERFPIDALWTSPAVLNDNSDSVAALLDAAQKHGIRIATVNRGSKARVGTTEASSDDAAAVSLEFLGPPTNIGDVALQTGDNAQSLVLRISWKGRTILLPGDVEGIGLESLLSQPCRNETDFLVAAHHGSKNSDPKRFVRWCNPQVVAISCGANRLDEETKELFNHGNSIRPVVSTAEHGALRYVIHRDGNVALTHWNGQKWSKVESQAKLPSIE